MRKVRKEKIEESKKKKVELKERLILQVQRDYVNALKFKILQMVSQYNEQIKSSLEDKYKNDILKQLLGQINSPDLYRQMS